MSKKLKPCILTLDPAAGIITNPQDIVAYIVRQFFGTPGRFSDIWKYELISFREIKSKFNGDINVICKQSEIALQKVLTTLLPTDNIEVECTLSHYEDIRYTLVINITTINKLGIKEPVLTTANVYVENDEFKINLIGDNVNAY